MSITNKFIRFENKKDYTSLKGDILNDSIVFIKDSKEIITHGKSYKAFSHGVLDSESGPVQYEVGDIIYNANGRLNKVHPDNWVESLGYPLGVVVIPNNFLPDGRARMMSLQKMSINMKNKSHEIDYPYIITSQGLKQYGFVSACSSQPMIFNPYNEDGSYNNKYAQYNVDYPSCLTDFDGYRNTFELEYATTSHSVYYVPAIGELGIAMFSINEIKTTLRKLNMSFDNNDLISSTPGDSPSEYWFVDFGVECQSSIMIGCSNFGSEHKTYLFGLL